LKRTDLREYGILPTMTFLVLHLITIHFRYSLRRATLTLSLQETTPYQWKLIFTRTFQGFWDRAA